MEEQKEESKLEGIVNKEKPRKEVEEEEEGEVRNIYKLANAEPEEYIIEGPKKQRPQELWEKTGFYQEKTTQQKIRVQLWPEHLPYDHLKRKRAFLFC